MREINREKSEESIEGGDQAQDLVKGKIPKKGIVDVKIKLLAFRVDKISSFYKILSYSFTTEILHGDYMYHYLIVNKLVVIIILFFPISI